MKILKAFKFQLKANESQQAKMKNFAGGCRFAWNKTLAAQKERITEGQSCMNYSKMAALLVSWKKQDETAFLKDIHSQILQQKLMDLDQALQEAFDKTNPKQFPQFKKKAFSADSFRYPQGFKIEETNNRVYLPKIGWVRYINSRKIEGTPKNVTVKRDCDHWYISIQTELEIEEPVHNSKTEIGIDMGVTQFATLSDGTVIPSINSYAKHESKLRKEQRKLSSKTKFSNNWKKQKKRVQKCHKHIRNVRNDFLQKATTMISKSHAIIVIEDLKTANMSKSASGTKENPGKNVKAKSGLNKSILDQSWGEFRRQLEYKQQWRGGQVLAIEPRYTSQKCSKCGKVSPDNRKTQSEFSCVSCGYEENADMNAARNILAAGQAVLACGGMGVAKPA
jgi:putative transposase